MIGALTIEVSAWARKRAYAKRASSRMQIAVQIDL